jgi:hypothetical protein
MRRQAETIVWTPVGLGLPSHKAVYRVTTVSRADHFALFPAIYVSSDLKLR